MVKKLESTHRRLEQIQYVGVPKENLKVNVTVQCSRAQNRT